MTPERNFRHRVLPEDDGQELLSVLTGRLNLGPRVALKKALKLGQILLNGRPARRAQLVRSGDEIRVQAPDIFAGSELVPAVAPDAPVHVLLETGELLATNKPAGRAAHPLRPDESETELGALGARHAECLAPRNPARPLEGGLVHRIDRGTSGVLVFARTSSAFDSLRLAWKAPSVEKAYLAWVHGYFEAVARFELWLEHDPKSRKRMCLALKQAPGGLRATTSVTPLRVATLATHEPATLVLIRIHTGVMHQIRATLAGMGHPVVGDAVYPHGRHARAKPPLDLAQALDPATTRLFSLLASALSSGAHGELEAEPLPERLPLGGFFLHALWLRVPRHEGLEEGVVAPLPPHFRQG